MGYSYMTEGHKPEVLQILGFSLVI